MPARSKKINFAKEQLEDGIALFFEKRYISSLTLLGASEEIMSRLIEEKTGKHPLENMWALANNIRSMLGNSHISKKEIHQTMNQGRNQVKHHDLGGEDEISFSRFSEAFMMIQRATGCAEYLGLKYKNRKLYYDWFNSE